MRMQSCSHSACWPPRHRGPALLARVFAAADEAWEAAEDGVLERGRLALAQPCAAGLGAADASQARAAPARHDHPPGASLEVMPVSFSSCIVIVCLSLQCRCLQQAV